MLRNLTENETFNNSVFTSVLYYSVCISNHSYNITQNCWKVCLYLKVVVVFR